MINPIKIGYFLMCALNKIAFVFFSMLILLACNSFEEKDYEMFASAISNTIYIEILDSEGNPLDNNSIYTDLVLTRNNDNNIPFNVNESVTTNFPLPMNSSMIYFDDRTCGYGESSLIVKIYDFECKLRGLFHFQTIYGGSTIKLIAIHPTPNVHVNEYGNFLKVTIKLPNTAND